MKKPFSLGFFFSCIFPLYPPNPHRSLSLCSEIGYTMREKRDKQTWVPVLTAAVEGGESQAYKGKRGNKHPLHLMQHIHPQTHICQKIYTYSHTHNYDCTNVTHRKTHKCTYYQLVFHHANNASCRQNVQEQIHIWTHFLSLPIPQQRFFFSIHPMQAVTSPLYYLITNLYTCNPFHRCVGCIHGWMLIPSFEDDGFHLHKPHETKKTKHLCLPLPHLSKCPVTAVFLRDKSHLEPL